MWKAFFSILMCTFLIFIGGYIELTYSMIKNFNIINEYPTIIIGLSAAIAALIGVIINQIWQSLNTNKNIKSTQDNLDKQLSHQLKIIEQQISFQTEQLHMQHKNALELKDKELHELRLEKNRELLEANKKEFYFTTSDLLKITDDYFINSFLLTNYTSKIDTIDHLLDYFNLSNIPTSLEQIYSDSLDERDSLLDKRDEILSNLNSNITTLNYLQNIKNISQKEALEAFIKEVKIILKLEHEYLKSIKEYLHNLNLSNYQDIEKIYDAVIDDLSDHFMKFKNNFNHTYNSSLRSKYNILLKNIE